MKNAAKLKYFFLLPSLLLASCAPTGDVTLKSPNEDGGLEGNASADQVEKQTTEKLEQFLKEIGKTEFYSYEVTINLTGQYSHFTNYYSPNAFYEKNDVFESSIGYAQNKNKEVFKYRLSEDLKTIYPSVFAYSGDGSLSRVKELYNAIETIPSFTFLSYSMDDFSAEYISGNKFLITDPNVSSIFQFMTSYGMSITSYVSAVYVEIIDSEDYIFRSTVELGNLGNIVGIYTKNDAGPTFDVNSKIMHGELDGVVSYEDTSNFFEMASKNNYKIEGIFEKLESGTQTSYPTNYYVTEDYFYVEYLGEYANSYSNWGYTIVPANTEVEIFDLTDGKVGSSEKMKLAYDACYRFRELDGHFYFDFFKGPLAPTGGKLVKVDSLPEVGEKNTYYVVWNEERQTNEVYQYILNGIGQYSYVLFSDWFNGIGDYYIQDSATFYLGNSVVSSIGEHYYEKSLDKENSYFCKDKGIINSLATGLFGWGWNPTNTWMDYAIGTKLDLVKKGGKIVEADIIMEVELSTEIKEIYYTLKDFGITSVPEIEEFLGGAF